MTHHAEETSTGRSTAGTGVESWILRLLLVALAAVAVSAVVASADDIKRYVRISQM